MSGTDTTTTLSELLELADILRPTWPAITAGIHASGVPTCDGSEPGGEGGGEPAEGEPAGGGEPSGEPAGEEKDHAAEAAKWKALARKHEQTAKANVAAAKKLAEIEEANKTESQRLSEQAAEAEKRAAAAEGTALRLEVALEKAPEGMSVEQIRKLAKRLSGNNREELEADAAELFADLTPDTGGGAPGRPRERLRSGALPSAGADDDDIKKIAAQVPRMY